jgi:cell division protein FtsW (lipid II flippase)
MYPDRLFFVLIGIMFMIVGAHIDIAKGLYKLSKFLYVTAIMLLILLVTPLGVSSHGATRWLRVPFIRLRAG